MKLIKILFFRQKDHMQKIMINPQIQTTIPLSFYGNKTPVQPKWCNGPLKLLDPPGPLTALASFPGSGNTWVRYLIQHATGYATGCIYLDRGLQQGDFPGEGIFDGSVIAVKTHCAKYVVYKIGCNLDRNSRVNFTC